MRTKRFLSLAIAIAMVFSLGSAAIAVQVSDLTDLPAESWYSYQHIVKAVENGIMQGVGGGKFQPKASITTAQAAAYLSRAMGATVKADITGASDVNKADWYATSGELAMGVQMGLFDIENGKLNPNKNLTREDVFVIFARVIKASGGTAADIAEFEDAADVSDFAVEAAASLVKGGYIEGTGTKLEPKRTCSREEFATILGRVLNAYVTESGEVSTLAADITNLVVKAPGVTLKDVTIPGDLIIAEGVGDGEVTLDGATVEGRLIVRGGGANSVKLINAKVKGDVVLARNDGPVRLYSEGATLSSPVIVDGGKTSVTIEGSVPSVVVAASSLNVSLLNGTFGDVTLTADAARISAGKGSRVQNITVSEDAADASVRALTGSVVNKVEVNGAGATLSGAGAVASVDVNASYVAVNTANTTVKVAADATSVTAGGKAVAAGSTATTPESLATTDFAPVEIPSDWGISSIALNGNNKLDINFTKTLDSAVLTGGTVVKFKNAVVSLSGASVAISGTKATITFNSDVFKDIANGDVIEVTISGGFAAKGGGSLTTNSKTYTYTVVATATADVTFYSVLAGSVPTSGDTAGGAASKTFTINVNNAVSTVNVLMNNTVAQTIAKGGTNASLVTLGSAQADQTFTVDTSSVSAAGGSVTFTITVSESGKTPIVYNITVTVAGTNPTGASATYNSTTGALVITGSNFGGLTAVDSTKITLFGQELTSDTTFGSAAASTLTLAVGSTDQTALKTAIGKATTGVAALDLQAGFVTGGVATGTSDLTVTVTPAAPSLTVASINYATELLTDYVDADLEWSQDNGTTYTQTDLATNPVFAALIPAAGSPAKTIYVRDQDGSLAVSISIPARPAAPTLSASNINYTAETFDAGTGNEYTIGAATAGTGYSNSSAAVDISSDIAFGSNNSIFVRVKATAAAFASVEASQALGARPDAPSELTTASVNYETETIDTLTTNNYAIVVGSTAPSLSTVGTAGSATLDISTSIANGHNNHIFVRIPATSSTYASVWDTGYKLPERLVAPTEGDFAITDDTGAGMVGIVNGGVTLSEYEFKFSDGASTTAWIAGAATVTTTITSGTITSVQIRKKATASTFSSEIATKTVSITGLDS